MGECEVSDIIELIMEICENTSVPKNVRSSLELMRASFNDESVELAVKIDSAIQITDELGQDPNLSPLVRTQIYNLTFLLEDLLK